MTDDGFTGAGEGAGDDILGASVDVVIIPRGRSKFEGMLVMAVLMLAFAAYLGLDPDGGNHQRFILSSIGGALGVVGATGGFALSIRQSMSFVSRLAYFLAGVWFVAAGFILPTTVPLAAMLVLCYGVGMGVAAILNMIDRRPLLTIDASGFLLQRTFSPVSAEWVQVSAIVPTMFTIYGEAVTVLKLEMTDGSVVRVDDAADGWTIDQIADAMRSAWKGETSSR